LTVPEQTPADIGARLKSARETLGITQEDAAAALSIQRTSVSAMEKGSRNVSATELARLASLYRRSVEWLLGTETAPATNATALFRATENLSENDQEQVLRFAQFLAATTSAAPVVRHDTRFDSGRE
jgi:transcriptional regulator with XRE-family HTH domain